MRLFFLAVAVLILVWLLRRALAAPRKEDSPPAAQTDLVSCAPCDVHLPKGDARSADGRYYCSDEHLRLGPKRG